MQTITPNAAKKNYRKGKALPHYYDVTKANRKMFAKRDRAEGKREARNS